MLNQCIEACPPAHWDDKVANLTFGQVAYHTLFFVDLYLSPNEDAFALRDCHQRGGDEREPVTSPGLSKDESLRYLGICREKAVATLSSELRQSLEGESGFSYRPISRGELHLYNLRHVQHHTGQLSAHLRKLGAAIQDPKSLGWVEKGWRERLETS
jgi:hypothetical protein